MMNYQQLLERNKDREIGQICYVTNDLRRTLAFMTEKLEMGPWKLLAISNESAENIRLDGNLITEPFRSYIAISNIGGMEIEVIQPGFGPNPYSRFLQERGEGLHHIKFKEEDNQRLKEETEYLAGLVGKPVQYSGEYGLDRHYYVDTYEELGSYVELGNFAFMPVPPEPLGQYPEE